MSRLCVFLQILCIAIAVARVTRRKEKTVQQKRQATYASCGVTEFQCRNGICIDQEWVCDTDNDCKDGSDEHNCPTNCTGRHQVKCDNGRCIPLEWRCDGEDDCYDGTDERGCDTFICSPGEVHCDESQGLCIERAWMCDTIDDCKTGWDEDPDNCAALGITHAPLVTAAP